MSGLMRSTRLVAALVLAGLSVPSATALAQGETAFPLLAYQPLPLGSAFNTPPTTKADPILQDDVEYQRHALMGAAMGAILGAITGYVAAASDDGGNKGESALIGAAVGAGVGLVIGYFIKTPKTPESAMGQVLPTTLAVIPSDEGTGVLVGWNRTW
jgi:hypothetical protein